MVHAGTQYTESEILHFASSSTAIAIDIPTTLSIVHASAGVCKYVVFFAILANMQKPSRCQQGSRKPRSACHSSNCYKICKYCNERNATQPSLHIHQNSIYIFHDNTYVCPRTLSCHRKRRADEFLSIAFASDIASGRTKHNNLYLFVR